MKIAEFANDGTPLGANDVEAVALTETEWQSRLSDRAYRVARLKGTEPAFTGRYWNNHEAGVYRCVCCATALFGSADKFDSGTGWPSFSRPLAEENVAEERDSTLGMVRVESLCARCHAHLGHVFPDGPRPTGLRYCINSEALMFDPA